MLFSLNVVSKCCTFISSIMAQMYDLKKKKKKSLEFLSKNVEFITSFEIKS